MQRRSFVLAGAPVLAAAQTQTAPDKGPPLSPELVKDFVVAGHGNLDKVKEMLTAQPALVRAYWDWGGGDFESALGGAGHMGRREIAEYLLSKGASVELPAAVMLGKLDFVKAAVAAFPGIEKTPGPHKIPLIAHAKKGGTEAESVLKFLEGLTA